MIKFNEIIKNEEYRKRIIKYFRLPMRISVSEEKFLSDLNFIKHFQPDWYETIVTSVENDFNKEASEQKTSTPDFSMEHILEPIISMIETNPRWQAFLEQDYSDILVNFEGVTNPHGFYVKENDGKHFVSIDLRSANWQSLQAITGIEESYEELIVKHTDNLIPPVSKTFRTKITGSLDAKRIMHSNQKLLSDNKEFILEAVYIKTGIDLRKQNPIAFYADEFLIEIDIKIKNKFDSLDIKELESFINAKTGVKIHFVPFTLKWLNVEKGCAKLYKNNKYEILNVSKDILLILNKLSHNIIPNDIDFEKIKLKGKSKEQYLQMIKDSLKIIDN